ncbi:MAG: DNA-binding transcriptional LysR family regulator [Bacteriovoracaceae bacterium]|jgi:DNA-binding transcriptional LysR family regulator
MELTRINYFMAIAQTQSIRKAAELLNISPAAISKSMKVLEEELGHKLFLSNNKGIELTPNGQIVYKSFSGVTDSLNQLDQQLEKQNSLSSLRLGTFEGFATYFVGPLTKEMNMFNSFHIHRLGPGTIESSLKNNEIDLGITYIPIPTDGVQHLKVAPIEMEIYGLKNKFKKAQLKELPFVTPLPPLTGIPNRMDGLDGWPDHKYPRSIIFKVSMMQSAIQICQNGDGVAYLPKFVARLHNQTCLSKFKLEPIPLNINISKEKQFVYIAKRAQDIEGPTHKKLAKLIRMHCVN